MVSTMVIHMQLHGYSCNIQYGRHPAIPRASGLCRNDRNSRNTEMETEHGTQQVLWCYLSSCLFRSLSSCFCSCSVWYMATSVPDQGRLFGGSFGLLIHLLDVCLQIFFWQGEDLLPISKQWKRLVKFGLHGNDGNGKRKWKHGNRNTESTVNAHKCPRIQRTWPYLWCCLSLCLLRVCFCSCSVWYAATSVPQSRSLIRCLVWFAYSFTRCLVTKTV